MKRILCAAFGAATVLGACAPTDITSRLDSAETLYSGFEPAGAYTPRPVGSRSDNDFLRFSTSGIR